jgi:hypothetical protein
LIDFIVPEADRRQAPFYNMYKRPFSEMVDGDTAFDIYPGKWGLLWEAMLKW